MLNLYKFKNLFYLHLNQTLLKMKLKSLISCSFLIFVVTFSYSQTSNNPWSLAVGVNAIGLMNESNIDSEMGFGFPVYSGACCEKIALQLEDCSGSVLRSLPC